MKISFYNIENKFFLLIIKKFKIEFYSVPLGDYIMQKTISEMDQKKKIIETITVNTNCQLVGMTGHIAVIFRQHSDPEKRKIKLPHQKSIP